MVPTIRTGWLPAAVGTGMSAQSRPATGHSRLDGIERRTFLDMLLGVGFVSTAVSFVYPIWRYLIPPVVTEATTNSVVAGKVTTFKNGSGTIVKFGSKPAIVVRTAQGEFRAFLAVCTHLDCTVQFKADTSQLWCACHNGLYDLGGNNVSGPPPRPLESFTVNLRGESGQEDVVVSKA
jgi:cytochrome b6-f complex iron-sulfur subunit